ncbi:hypothetical protein OH491_14380 [Termitidicoccus mucosus]
MSTARRRRPRIREAMSRWLNPNASRIARSQPFVRRVVGTVA